MKRLPPVHPGEVLREEFMKPLGLSQYRVAKDIGVPALRISQIVRGRRAVTADTALRLARYLGTSAALWLRMQARYDLEVAEVKIARRINREVKAVCSTRTANPRSPVVERTLFRSPWSNLSQSEITFTLRYSFAT